MVRGEYSEGDRSVNEELEVGEGIVILGQAWLQHLIFQLCLEVFDAVVLLCSGESRAPLAGVDGGEQTILFGERYEIVNVD